MEPMYNLFNQMLLPLFVMALLFGIAGVSPDIVVRAFASVVIALIGGAFGLLRALLTPRTTWHKTPPRRQRQDSEGNQYW